MADIFEDFGNEKAVDGAISKSKNVDMGKFKFETFAEEQNFRVEWEKYIKDMQKGAREKTDGGIFKAQYSDDYDLGGDTKLGQMFRKNPWMLKTARSKYAWNTKNITSSSFSTGNALFDEFTKTLKVNWFIDQGVLLLPNLTNLIFLQIDRRKNKKEMDKYVSKLQMFGGDVKNLKSLSDPKVFQQAVMAIRNYKGDKKSVQEKLAILYNVAHKHGGHKKEDLKLRKDMIYRGVANVNLLKSFEKDAEYIRKAVANNPALINDPKVADIMNKYDPTTQKFNFDPNDYKNAVKNVEVLRKAYPYNDPEKYAQELAKIHQQYGNKQGILNKKLKDFNDMHRAMGSVKKDKKGKEVKFSAPTVAGKAPTDMEKTVYKNLSTQDAQKFMFNFEYIKGRFDKIDGKELSGSPQQIQDDADIANEQAIINGGGALTPDQVANKKAREERFEKNKKDKLFEKYKDVLNNLMDINNPADIKKKIDFGKIDDMPKKIEEKFRADLIDNPNMTSKEVKEKELEIKMQLEIVKSIYSSFGLDEGYKKEKDPQVSKELEEQYKERKEKLKTLDEFDKEFGKELKLNRDLAKQDIELSNADFALSDKARKDYLRNVNNLNLELREDLAYITHPSNKVKDDEDKFDADTLTELKDSYSKISDLVEKEKQLVEKLANAKPSQVKNIEKEIQKTRQKVQDDLAKLKQKSEDIVAELPNKGRSLLYNIKRDPQTGKLQKIQIHPLKMDIKKGEIDLVKEMKEKREVIKENEKNIKIADKRISNFKQIVGRFDQEKKNLLDQEAVLLNQKIGAKLQKDKKAIQDEIDLVKNQLEMKSLEEGNLKSPVYKAKQKMDQVIKDRKEELKRKQEFQRI